MNRSKVFNIFSTLFIIVTLAIGVYLVGIKTGFIKHAGGIPANLVVDAGNSFASPADCWKNLAQGGESKARMLVSVIPQIKKLAPEYIRIDHIYDNYDVVSRDGQGNLNFNWTNLDLTVQDILASGALPFFSLSYMPPAISKDGQVESIPANWSDWQLVVQKTVEHYSGRSGMNLNNVYYEVWNEPDAFGGFKPGGSKNYLDLYFYAQNGAKNASGVKPFKIGGPATAGLYKSWLDGLLTMAQDGRIRMDFFSWHNYYSDADRYNKDMDNLFSWLAQYPNFINMELIVSEMGIDGKNNPAYDGNLSAIHTLSSVSSLQANVNKCFSFEIIDGAGPEKFWGRWGMLTNEKYGQPEIKTRYHAIEFLNRMTGNRMSTTGLGSWVKAFTRYDGKTIRVLVSNYAPDGHSEVVPFKLINLPFRNFTFKRVDFLGGASSQNVAIDADSWETTLGMEPNTAAIFEVTPL
ncbi:MAG TPA: hypothetical protein VL401_01030 [Alphaproteobacteria bacterium]|jgi:hypothetical protein|nr:hypothetical protein [Alphaproteobacteria bacterium]